MTAPSKPADPKAIVGALERHRVEYVVVGGWAAVTYGVDRATFDLDLVVEASDENAAALASALEELDARRDLGAGASEELQISGKGTLLAAPLRVVTSAGPVDVLSRIPGVRSYAELRADARRARFGDGTGFVVVSKAGLEAIKEAVAREADPARGDRDRRDLEELRALPDPELPPA
jgi:hypothetical protein